MCHVKVTQEDDVRFLHTNMYDVLFMESAINNCGVKAIVQKPHPT